MKKFKKRYLLVLLLLCCVGVVYAMLISKLSITGGGRIKGNDWNVVFRNINESNGSVEGTAEVIGSTGITFNADLEKPGDYYEFSVDVANIGSLDAMVSNYAFEGIDNIKELVKFDVSYIDGVSINKTDRLASMEEETLLIRMEYRKDIDQSDLNQDDIEINVKFEMDYIQDDGSSQERLKSLKNNLITEVKNVNGLVFNKTISSGEEGVYKLNNSYFFRGGEINNNVVIDDVCYYVIRTTEEGNIRLLYNGELTESGCNNENKFIGESVFNSDVANANYEDSEIRNVLLNWYNMNLIKYDNSIIDGYCSDTRMVDGEYYNKLKSENGIIDLDCNNVINDKVGLMSIDEILMVGYGRNGSYKSYLDANKGFYSMSIYSNKSNKVRVISIDEYASKDSVLLDTSLGVRPVITINGNAGYSSGDGSIQNPYVISLKV